MVDRVFITDMIVCAMNGIITGMIIGMEVNYLIIPSIIFFIAFHMLRWQLIDRRSVSQGLGAVGSKTK